MDTLDSKYEKCFFTNQTIDKLKHIIQIYNDHSQNKDITKNATAELEIRVGRINEKTNKFQANVSKVVWSQFLINSKSPQAKEETVCDFFDHNSEIYDQSQWLRITTNLITHETIYEIKKKIQSLIFSFYEYDFKVNLAIEQRLDAENDDRFWMKTLTKKHLTRKRLRYIYDYPCFQVHLSKIEETKYFDNEKLETIVKYEIELEAKQTLIEIKSFCQSFNILLKSVMTTKLSYLEKPIENNVIHSFNNLVFTVVKDSIDIFKSTKYNQTITNKIYLYESRPKNVKAQFLSNKRFSLTNKLDGQNFFLFVNVSHTKQIQFYLLNTTFCQVIYTSYQKELLEYDQSIFQGELVQNSYNVFDCLIFKGNDMSQNNHSERMNTFHNMNCRLELDWLKMKYFFSSASLKNNILNCLKYMKTTFLDQVDTMNDGVMFIPIDDPFRNDNTLKFKFASKMTIDFKIVLIDQKDNLINYGLYVLDKQNDILKITQFSFGTPRKFGFYQSNEVLDDTQICEFGYNNSDEKFAFYRYRTDKTKPNFFTIASDVMNDIINPVTIASLINGIDKNDPKDKINSSNTSTQNTNETPLNKLRKYHNLIKQELIQQYCKEKYVLDIGFGKGGDIMKYVHSQTKLVIGIEPDFSNLQNAYTRLSKHSDQIQKKFQINNLNGESCKEISALVQKLPNRKVDIVCLFFSLTFFFMHQDKLNSLFDTINENLATDGYFIGTVMNGERTKSYLSSYNGSKTETNFFDMKMDNKYMEESNQYVGQKILINFSAEDTIVSNQTEGVVFFPLLITFLKMRNFTLIRHEPLKSNDSDISEFSELYDLFVFQKQSKVKVNFISKSKITVINPGQVSPIVANEVINVESTENTTVKTKTKFLIDQSKVQDAKSVKSIKIVMINAGLSTDLTDHLIEQIKCKKLLDTKEKLIQLLKTKPNVSLV